ncbi:MAG: hypothetical protein ACTHLL_07035 [Candidatus Nitrosocosmicus sp.]
MIRLYPLPSTPKPLLRLKVDDHIDLYSPLIPPPPCLFNAMSVL